MNTFLYEKISRFQISDKPNTRELLLKLGEESLRDYELIMILLGTGTKTKTVEQLAKSVLEIIQKNSGKNLKEKLLKINGMGKSKTALICAALELGKRYNSFNGIKIKQPEDLIPLVQHYALQNQEHLILVTLNGSHEIIQIKLISIGTLNRSLIHPREIFSEAIKDRAAGIIICHNHPSGSLLPSDNDIEVTQRLKSVSEIIGIPLLDHIILSQKGFFSMQAHKTIL